MRYENKMLSFNKDALLYSSERLSYHTIKREIAKIIHIYLKSNPDLRKEYATIYDKVVEEESKGLLVGVSPESPDELKRICEMLADSRIKEYGKRVDAEQAMKSIIESFGELK